MIVKIKLSFQGAEKYIKCQLNECGIKQFAVKKIAKFLNIRNSTDFTILEDFLQSRTSLTQIDTFNFEDKEINIIHYY